MKIYVYDTEADSNILIKFLYFLGCQRYMAVAGEFPEGKFICRGATAYGAYKKAVRSIKLGRATENPKLVMFDNLDA